MRGLNIKVNHYAGGFTYDNVAPFNDESDDGEHFIYRLKYNWFIEALREHMPTRKNSELMWAVHVKDGEEINITNKVKKELKNVKRVK